MGFLATVAGVLFGFWFYGIPAEWIHKIHQAPPRFRIWWDFWWCSVVCTLLGGLIGKLLSKLFKWTGLSWLDRLMGAGFGLVRGAVAVVAFVSVLMAFTPKPVPQWMTGSYLLPYAIDASNIVASLAPRALKEPVRQSIGEIRQAWDDEVRKSQRRERKKAAEPKSPPPKAVDQ